MEQCRGTHMDKKDEILVKTPPCLRLSISPGEIFYFLIFINLKLNYSENMNGPTDRSNDFCKTFGSYFRQAAEAQKKLVEITMSKVSPDFENRHNIWWLENLLKRVQ